MCVCGGYSTAPTDCLNTYLFKSVGIQCYRDDIINKKLAGLNLLNAFLNICMNLMGHWLLFSD